MGTGVTLEGRAIAQNGNVTCLTIHSAVPLVSQRPIVPTTVPGTKVRRLPNTGGAPIRNEEMPWSIAVLGVVGVTVLFLGIQAYRRTYKPKP